MMRSPHPRRGHLLFNLGPAGELGGRPLGGEEAIDIIPGHAFDIALADFLVADGGENGARFSLLRRLRRGGSTHDPPRWHAPFFEASNQFGADLLDERFISPSHRLRSRADETDDRFVVLLRFHVELAGPVEERGAIFHVPGSLEVVLPAFGRLKVEAFVFEFHGRGAERGDVGGAARRHRPVHLKQARRSAAPP